MLKIIQFYQNKHNHQWIKFKIFKEIFHYLSTIIILFNQINNKKIKKYYAIIYPSVVYQPNKL